MDSTGLIGPNGGRDFRARRGSRAGCFPGANGRIAFISDRAGSNLSYDIYTIKANGTGLIRATNNAVGDFAPAWSPNGARIAFERSGDIYTMNPDGSGQVNISRNSAFDLAPSWSPDGKKIAFWSFSTESNADIYTMNADGTGRTNLTNTPTNGIIEVDPAWSPDGTRIAFQSNLDGGDDREIFTINANGTGTTQLTYNGVHDTLPTWSPDGTRISFSRLSPSLADDEIYVMNADGTDQINLTNSPLDQHDSAWSPNGIKLAFGQEGAIYTMNADGSGKTKVPDTDAGGSPDWQPVNRPPSCSRVQATPNALAPAGGTFRLVILDGATDPDGDRLTLRVTGVTQDEPVKGSSSDSSFPDARRSSRPNQIYLRAERRAGSDGRVYRINVLAADTKGGSCSTVRRVRVPAAAVDSAPPSFDSFGSG